MDSDLPPSIGRYELVRPLGQGGMGRVLLARDTVLGRSVALKLVRSDLGLPPETRALLFTRMRQEARAAAGVSHPHVVVLHDMGEDAALGLFLVFEYIAGSTLRERVQAGPMAPHEVSAMARALGDALTCAHDAGVLHRDVKPENMLMSKAGPKIADFGIARLPDSTLTSAGTVLGTPAYLAPEALARGEFSPASDQFALAATLYEALTARRAFPGDDALTVASRVASEAPTLTAALLPYGRALVRVDAMLARGMAKDPKDRFPSCAAFGEALANALDVAVAAPTWSEAPPPSAIPSFFARARRSIVPRATRRVHNVAAGLAVLVIAGLALFGRRARLPGPSGVSMRRVSAAFAQAVVAPRGAAPAGSAKQGARPGASTTATPLPLGSSAAPAAALTSAFQDAGDGVGFAADDGGADASHR